MAKATKKKETKVKELAPDPTILTNEELGEVKQHLSEIEALRGRVGDLELQKGITMNNYMQVAASFQALQKQLEEKYGSITVDTTTGIYTVKEADGAN